MFVSLASLFIVIAPVQLSDDLTEKDIADFVKLLDNADADARIYGAANCGLYKIAKTEAPLTKRFEVEKDARVRTLIELSLFAIRGQNKELSEAVRKSIKSEDESIRKHSAAFAAMLGEKSLPMLEEIYKANLHDNTQISRPLSRAASADGLSLLPFLNSKNARIRWEAAHAAGILYGRSQNRDPRLLQRLAELLDDKELTGKVGEEAAKAMTNAGQSAVKLLREAMRSKDSNARAMAAYAIGKMQKVEGVKAAEPEMLECLRDASPKVREEAVVAFESLKLNNPKAVPLLVDCLKNKSAKLRELAADALGGMGLAAKDAEPHLTSVAKNDEAIRVRAFAIWALCNVAPDNKEATPLAVAMLPENDVRYIAIWALGDLGPRGKSAIKDVKPFLEHDDPEVQAMAAGCLLLIGADQKEVEQHARRLLKETKDMRWLGGFVRILKDCERAGSRAKFLAPALIDAYRQTKDTYLQERLAETLRKIDPDEAKKLK